MKKTILLGAAVLLTGVLMTGCDLFAKANGLVLYGDEQKVMDAMDSEKEDYVDAERYEVKVMEDGEERVMVLNEKTAKAIAEKELLKKVTQGTKTEPVSSVATLAEGEAFIYAKIQQEEQTFQDGAITAAYGGNWIIGNNRAYVDKFLIVTDADWVKMDGEVKSVAVMKYKKDPGEKIMDFDVEDSQLVRIGG